MQLNRTPGEWTFNEIEMVIEAEATKEIIEEHPKLFKDCKLLVVCDVPNEFSDGSSLDTATVDGRLMAAAPELYEALENLLNEIIPKLAGANEKRYKELYCADAAAAIAKAKGEM